MKKFFLLVGFCLLNWGSLTAQLERNCGTTSSETQAFRTSSPFLASASRTTGGGIRIIPVAVNVIYYGSFANISDGQVQSGIDVLNAAFSGGYGGVNTNIQFCLAGINRAESQSLSSVTKGVNELAAKNLIGEDPTQYMNVWIVERLQDPGIGDIEGWTPYPQYLTITPDYDGVMLFHRVWGNTGSAVGFDKHEEGKIAVHEVGHWLGLVHVFEGGCDYQWNCNTAGDCCCDTPPQSEPYRKCREGKNSCDSDSPDLNDPVHNYMGYSPDDCLTEFTQCQSDRMNFYLESIRFDAFFETGECPVFKSESAPILSTVTLDCWPVPAQDQLHIRVGLEPGEWCRLELVDALGRVVWATDRQSEQAGGVACTLSLQDGVGAGIYYLRLRHKAGMEVRKVVLE